MSKGLPRAGWRAAASPLYVGPCAGNPGWGVTPNVKSLPSEEKPDVGAVYWRGAGVPVPCMKAMISSSVSLPSLLASIALKMRS
jgi:hypothetical protein